MKKIVKYLKPKQRLSYFNNIKADFLISITFIGVFITLLTIIQELVFIERSEASNISILSSLLTILFLLVSLFLLKSKGIKTAGNIFSMGLVFILLATMNILDKNVSAMYKYIDTFYVILALHTIGVMYATRLVLVINSIFILASTTRIFLFALEYSPEKKEYFIFGFISHTIALMIITTLIFFEKKFTSQTIKKAENETRIKEKQNQELAASEEEIRAGMEELKTMTDALKETNEELMLAKTKAEESDRLKSVFLSNMSHEIRTPLNGITGFTNLLTSKKHTDAQDKHYADIISKSSRQLLKIIDDLIEVSQLETNQFKIYSSPTNIEDILNELIKDFEPIVVEKGIKLFIDPNCKNTHRNKITTDSPKLRSILKQLIDNALKFTSIGFVRIRYYFQAEYVLFELKDTGIGFEQKKTPDIFQRFVQANEKIAIDYGGLGIGLTIAKLIVESLGGEISAKSEPGKGSTFCFKIPDESINNQKK